jgi:two-component system sensor histidine kinase PilS (NtrC family)
VLSIPPTQTAKQERQELRRRLSWLMGGRLLVATLLLGGTMLLALDRELGVASFTPRFLLALILSTYCASLAFALWLPRAEQLNRFASVQVGWDLGLTTGLVYVAGGVASGFTFLYGATVLMAAIVVGPRAAQVATVVSLILYLAIGLALTNGWVPYPLDQPADRYLLKPTDATFTMLVNILGLLLVAFLATNLSGRLRLTGGRLREAAAQAAELSRLNEDIIRSLSSGLITTDTNRVVSTVNPAGLEIFRAKPSEMFGRPIGDFFLDPSATQPGHKRAEGTGSRPDHSTFPVGFSKTPLVNAEGDRTGELFLFQDLTELTELRRTAERAERLAALGRLSAALAHEIRNPLGSISGSVQLVRDSVDLDEEDRRLLGIVLHEVDRLNALVSTMLQVGRPRDPARVRTDLVALTRDVVEVAAKDLKHAARIAVDTQDGEVNAWIDADQIRQVIWNLLNNALTHAPASSLVRIEVRSAAGDALWTIEDQGPGVPAEARGHLFDMFYSKRPHGVGLGLALVDQIVRAHGGEVSVVSPPGQGAKFQVRLPEAPAARSAASS